MTQCIRCATVFESPQADTHICPNCHFVFTERDTIEMTEKKDKKKVASSVSTEMSEVKHRLFEENTPRCAFHPDVDALGHCRRCGRPLCYACANDEGEGLLCKPCEEGRSPIDVPPPPQEAVAERTESGRLRPLDRESVSNILARGPYVAWEHRKQIGYVRAFITTLSQSLFSPVRFFSKTPITSDYQSPLSYGFIWTIIGIIGGIFWRVVVWIYSGASAIFKGEQLPFSFSLSQRGAVGTFLLLASPLFGMAVLLSACALYHVFVVMMTSRHARFQSTMRVICYSAGTNVFFFLPFFGALIGGVWQLVLVTVGLREMHRMAYPTAVAVALIPYTLLLVFCLAFMYWAVSGYDFGLLDFLVQIFFGTV